MYEALNILNKAQFQDKFFSQPFQASLHLYYLSALHTSAWGKIDRAIEKSFTGITPAAGTPSMNPQHYRPPSKISSTPPSQVSVQDNQPNLNPSQHQPQVSVQAAITNKQVQTAVVLCFGDKVLLLLPAGLLCS